jgi:HD-like signal output (HDOD) protein
MIQFKQPQLHEELPKVDFRIRAIIYALSGFLSYNYGLDITLTELLRTKAQQDEYYKNDPAYQKAKFVSTHQVGRAVDIRIDFDDEVLEAIKHFLDHFKYNRSKPLYLIHDIGLGRHLHIQVDGDGTTEVTA